MEVKVIYQFTDTGTDMLLLQQKCPFSGVINTIIVTQGEKEVVKNDAAIFAEMLGVDIERLGPIHDGIA